LGVDFYFFKKSRIEKQNGKKEKIPSQPYLERERKREKERERKREKERELMEIKPSPTPLFYVTLSMGNRTLSLPAA
jgi:hypothetical protein